MDLESELRSAMAEQVAESAAPPSLVDDVRRRHRRRVTRIRVTVGVAAAAVAVAVAAPGYQSFRAEPVGSKGGPDGAGGTPAPSGPAPPPVSTLPKSASPAPGTGGGKPAGRDAPESGHRPSGGIAGIRLPRWVTFLPAGLRAEAPCASATEGSTRTTTCRWRGPDGWVEIRLVRGSGLGGPEDLMRAPAVPRPTSVRGARAISADRPDSSRQIAWIARPGVGVVVVVGEETRDQLMRVAEGVRP
jgi:hypothetical protein